MGKLLILSLEESEYSLYNKIMEIVNTTGITTYSLTSLKALNDVPVERLKEIIADHSRPFGERRG